jgi:type VI secretion system secreted protein VgrG
VPSDVIYRPRRLTRRPVIQGPQTAMVVGPAGEEIYCDKYGRVKVLFPWDRDNTGDENASCWIRVSQPWAGVGFGGMIIPRIKQEVIVEFLEGDPDRPIITGRVYNDAATVPYALPTNQTRSTLKTNSSPGGGGFNEIRLEDKKDSEEFFVHAQKDMNIIVLNDQTSTIKKNRTTTIEEVDDTLTVKAGKQTIKVKGDQATTIESGNQTITVDTGNQTTTVKTGNHEQKVSAGTSKIDAAQSITLVVGGSKIEVSTSAIKLSLGPSSIELTPAGVKIAGVQAELAGSAMTTISGGLVKIN